MPRSTPCASVGPTAKREQEWKSAYLSFRLCNQAGRPQTPRFPVLRILRTLQFRNSLHRLIYVGLVWADNQVVGEGFAEFWRSGATTGVRV